MDEYLALAAQKFTVKNYLQPTEWDVVKGRCIIVLRYITMLLPYISIYLPTSTVCFEQKEAGL